MAMSADAAIPMRPRVQMKLYQYGHECRCSYTNEAKSVDVAIPNEAKSADAAIPREP